MVSRIRALLEHKQFTSTQFADLIGVGRPVMSHILSERNKPSLEVVQRIISAFPDISLPWLLSGTGEMLNAPSTESATAVPASLPAVVSPVDTPPVTEPVIAAIPARQAPAPPPIATKTPVEGPPVAVATPVAAPIAPTVPVSAAPPVAIGTPKPFRAPRFAATPPAATPINTAEAPLPVAPLAAPSPPNPSPAVAPAEAAMLPFLAEPGKAIRRIVIFYRDGSFADYQPEQ